MPFPNRRGLYIEENLIYGESTKLILPNQPYPVYCAFCWLLPHNFPPSPMPCFSPELNMVFKLVTKATRGITHFSLGIFHVHLR